MIDDLTLREATDADLPTLVGVLVTAFAEYRDRLDPPSGAHGETVEKLRAVLGSASAVLALVGAAPAGCVFYAHMDGYVDLFRLGVLPEYRQSGVGQTLVGYVEARALELGLRRVQLGVRVALPRNRAYYERLGYRFVEARSHTGYSRPTYVILEKMLE